MSKVQKYLWDLEYKRTLSKSTKLPFRMSRITLDLVKAQITTMSNKGGLSHCNTLNQARYFLRKLKTLKRLKKKWRMIIAKI